MTISNFIELPPFEDKTTEYKLILNEGEKALGWLKTVDAFANTLGGDLYVGVKDKTYEVVGLKKEDVDRMVQLFIKETKEHITPSIEYKIEYLPFYKKNETLYVIKFTILKKNLIYYLKYGGFSSVFIREEGRNSIASPEKMNSLFANYSFIPYDQSFTDILFNKDDFKDLFKIYKDKNNGEELSFKELLSIGFISKDNYLSKGALLFKDDYKGNSTLTLCMNWEGINKGGNKFISSGDLNNNILKNIDVILDFIDQFNYKVEEKLDFGRKTYPSYPSRSIFEAIVNAYAHKNYYLSSPIEIDIFKDRLEITSPGSLLDFKDLKNEKNINSILPSRRNEIICSVFSIIKYMERKGSGFDKISEDYMLADDKHKPFIDSNSSYFTLTLPNLNFKNGVIDENNASYLDVEIINNLKVKEKELSILGFCYAKERSINEIAAFLKILPSTYLRKNILEKLVNLNLLIKNKNEKAIKYLSNREFVKVK